MSSLFGASDGRTSDWNVHIIDLSHVLNDLLPFAVGATLETFASVVFKRGPGATHPTVVVLEEAHHYLRQLPGDAEFGQQALAYERLAKEGRKFGVSLIVSTQRPSEVSPTVLAQCGTWAVFLLTNESDQRAISTATESNTSQLSNRLATLGRGEALVFGVSMPVMARMKFDQPQPAPTSSDPKFAAKWSTEPDPF